MRTSWIWSVSLGRWWNVHVRLHLFLFLFAAFAIFLSPSSPEPHWLAHSRGISITVIVFVSVLLHEIAHVVIARRLGGIADEIVLGPLGGLSPIRVPYEPHSELVAIMAGTLMNAAICFVCALSLALSADGINLPEMLRPTLSGMQTHEPLTLEPLLKLIFWINWSLILVNLLPVFPFDGGRSLHAVTAFFWHELDPRLSNATICRLGKVVAALFFVLACIRYTDPGTWLALTLLSIYIFFYSRREEIQQAEVDHDDDTVFGYDFSQGYTSLERSLEDDGEERESTSQPGLIARWLEQRREAKRIREREQEADDERRVDEVLERLHLHGMRSLSQNDKALLDRVSKRYRSRQS